MFFYNGDTHLSNDFSLIVAFDEFSGLTSYGLSECAVPEKTHTPPRKVFVLHPIPQEIPVKLHTLLLRFWLLRLPGTFRGVFRGVSRPSDVVRPV